MGSDEFFALVLSWLGTYLVHSSLILLTVWALMRGRSHRRPRLAERAWRFALLAGVLSASLQVLTGTRPLLGSLSFASESAALARNEPLLPTEGPRDEPVQRARETTPLEVEPVRMAHEPRVEEAPPLLVESAEPVDAAGPSLTKPTSSEPRAPLHLGDAAPLSGPAASVAPLSKASGSKPSGSTPSRAPRAILPARILDVAGLLLVSGWGLAALAGTALFTAAWMRLHRRLHARTPVESGPLVDLLRELERRAGTTRPVRLSLSTRTESPLTVGWLRREIVLPERALGCLSSRQIETMLAHELAHAVRNDPIWFSVYALCERVLFFQPLNRLARAELHDAAELLCDDWAVRWTGHRLALASCLAEVAHWIVGARRLPVPAMADRPSRLRVRIERLLDDRRSPLSERAPRGFVVVSGLALTLCVLAVPGVSSAAPVSGPSERSPAGPKRTERTLPRERSRDATELPELPKATPPAPRMDIAPADVAPAEGPADLLRDHAHLEEELADLEREIEALSSELVELGLSDRLGSVVEDLRAKLAALRGQQARLSALLGHAFQTGTPHTSHDVDSSPRKSP